jgi:hypothetical protein
MKFVMWMVVLPLTLANLHCATSINDFSGTITGYNFTENLSDYYGSSAPSAFPSANNLPGQVDIGYYKVNFSDTDPFTVGSFSSVSAYQGQFGTYDPDLGRYVGGNWFDLSLVSGFWLSLRREDANTAGIINLYILSDQDLEYYLPVNLSILSTTQFTDVYLDLSASTVPSGAGAVNISIKGDWANPSSIYNFSVDSLRAVPEPSTSILLLSGLGVLALRRLRLR